MTTITTRSDIQASQAKQLSRQCKPLPNSQPEQRSGAIRVCGSGRPTSTLLVWAFVFTVVVNCCADACGTLAQSVNETRVEAKCHKFESLLVVEDGVKTHGQGAGRVSRHWMARGKNT